jgi:mono/diheme cytochrome c family protein
MVRRLLLPISLILLHVGADAATESFAPGQLVRVTKGEMLQFEGKNLVGAGKGEEFPVLQQDAARGVVYVPYYKKDGGPIAVTISTEAVEAAPRDGWLDMLEGFEAFRDQRYDTARQRLTHATEDEKYKALATALSLRVQGAIASRSAGSIAALRETSAQLEKLGYLCLALALDQGIDRLAGSAAPPSKLNRDDLTKRVASSTRALARARQAIAMRCMVNADEEIRAGLEAEPNRPELKAFQAKVEKDIAEAADRYADADRMRRFPKGTPHALTALEMGLKVCADHPKLIALKKEMGSAFEERTAPPVDTAFLAVAKGGDAKLLADGQSLYANRCTECHDLELIDSRSLSSWEKMVGSMSRRAGLNDEQQAHVLAYIAAAQKVVEAKPAE